MTELESRLSDLRVRLTELETSPHLLARSGQLRELGAKLQTGELDDAGLAKLRKLLDEKALLSAKRTELLKRKAELEEQIEAQRKAALIA